jgi:hypothetical protein
MITLPGTLLVKTIHGRRGDFAVGTLLTEIGEFKVKDTLLDQFSEGEYRGRFALARLYLGSYSWKGATISELRANVTDIELDEATEKPLTTEAPVVADPIDETAPPAVSADSVTTSEAMPPPSATEEQPASPTGSATAERTTDDVDAAIAALTSVKLDPTVDRALFRIQRDRLKTSGYRFDASAQNWLPPAVSE